MCLSPFNKIHESFEADISYFEWCDIKDTNNCDHLSWQCIYETVMYLKYSSEISIKGDL